MQADCFNHKLMLDIYNADTAPRRAMMAQQVDSIIGTLQNCSNCDGWEFCTAEKKGAGPFHGKTCREWTHTFRIGKMTAKGDDYVLPFDE